MRLPISIKGALLGLVIYDALLVIHLVKFGGIYHSVPNIAGYAGRYPGYGFTWDLTLINLPADLLRPRPTSVDFRDSRDPKGWVTPQGLTHYSNHPKVLARDPRGWAATKVPRAWNPWSWLLCGMVGYALAGVGVGCLVGIGAALVRWGHASPTPQGARPRRRPPRRGRAQADPR